jgi:ribonuclease HII
MSRPTLAHERRLQRHGYSLIAGIDEAGRGAWAGPVVAAAVIFPLQNHSLTKTLRGVNDSKQLTPRRREALIPVIQAASVTVGIGLATPTEIDTLNILAATRLAMQRAVAMLHPQPEALLIDAVNLSSLLSLPQRSMNYGDCISLAIAAASILAKVTRDRIMRDLDARHPGYGFARHKGYGTALHKVALEELGVSEAHRRSYGPVAKVLRQQML